MGDALTVVEWSPITRWRWILKAAALPERWEAIRSWSGGLGRAMAEVAAGLSAEMRIWEEHLASLGGDPSRRYWASFRPLRLTREEDWSDWLAFLLQESRGGGFATSLFDPPGTTERGRRSQPRVDREALSASGQFRADLVVDWRDGTWHHVEVKIGDEDFAKTFETGRQLRERYGATVWADFVLLPDESLQEWNRDVVAAGVGETTVAVITWADVVLAMRKALWKGTEPTDWNVWAAAFCGSIEQKILGHPCWADVSCGAADLPVARLRKMVEQMDLLRKGRAP